MARSVEAKSWGFADLPEMDSGYSAMLAADDGAIYTALCTHNGADDALLVRFDPAAGATSVVADMGVVTGEKGRGGIPQGKVHTRMGESRDGRIVFATHPTYPAGPVPNGAPAGWLIAYDPASGISRAVARAPDQEAIITAAFDAERNVMVGLSNPSGRLLVCDLDRGEMSDLGPVTNGASPCRTIGIDGDGHAWFTREPGEIVSLAPGASSIKVSSSRMPHPDLPGESGMGVWRTALWDDAAGVFYAVHARTSHLFSFETHSGRTQAIGSVAAEADREDMRSTFASLALARAPNGTLFTVAARGVFDFFNSQPLRGAAHLVSFAPVSGRIVDHGPIVADGVRRLWGSQNAAVSRDGRSLYLLGAVEAADDEIANRTKLPVVAAGGETALVGYQLRIVAIDLSLLADDGMEEIGA